VLGGSINSFRRLIFIRSGFGPMCFDLLVLHVYIDFKCMGGWNLGLFFLVILACDFWEFFFISNWLQGEF
jgi:hypothetical protein